MEEQTNLRIGLVGCGRHGGNLAQAIVRSKALRLVACADPDEAAAGCAAALAPEVSTHTSVEALLADREVDAIIVATPHHLLAPVALTALHAGKHVMAEKPIALNEGESIEIEQAAAQAGVCYMAGYSFRFLMARYVHNLLAAGVAGEIRAVTGRLASARWTMAGALTRKLGAGHCYFSVPTWWIWYSGSWMTSHRKFLPL